MALAFWMSAAAMSSIKTLMTHIMGFLDIY